MKSVQERITKHAFFRGMRAEHLKLLTESAREMVYGKNELLFRQGEPANAFFLIQSGTIALEAQTLAGASTLVQQLGPGEVMGWSWLFPPFVWNFQARAIEPASATVLNGAQLLVAAERDHELGYDLMKRVTQVVIRRLQATRQQLPALSAPTPAAA